MAKSLGVRGPCVYMPRPISYPAMIVWRFLARLTGKKSPITPETLRAAYSIVRYDNSKITKALGITFAPMEKSIAAIAALYSAEHRKFR